SSAQVAFRRMDFACGSWADSFPARARNLSAPSGHPFPRMTVYAILPGRGYEQSVRILGAAYAGFLVHDGWAPYYKFVWAFHQSCLNHLLRRSKEMAQIASPTAAAFPLAVGSLLKRGLQLRDRYQQDEISEHGLRTATGRLEGKLDLRVGERYPDPAPRPPARPLQ